MADLTREIPKKQVGGRWAGCGGPRTVAVARNDSGFGFTLRHFIVYPPESALQQLEEEEEFGDGGKRKRSKLSSLEPMDTIFVRQVKEGGPADGAGLQRGDRIINVNGEGVTGKTYSQVIALIQASDASLKLLVVPKDEDILQVAYESSAYNQTQQQFSGQACGIPAPPQLMQPSAVGSDMAMHGKPPLGPHRFKSELIVQPPDDHMQRRPSGDSTSSGRMGSEQTAWLGIDPQSVRQRTSTSSLGSISSGSSLSASREIGLPSGESVEVRSTSSTLDSGISSYLPDAPQRTTSRNVHMNPSNLPGVHYQQMPQPHKQNYQPGVLNSVENIHCATSNHDNHHPHLSSSSSSSLTTPSSSCRAPQHYSSQERLLAPNGQRDNTRRSSADLPQKSVSRSPRSPRQRAGAVTCRAASYNPSLPTTTAGSTHPSSLYQHPHQQRSAMLAQTSTPSLTTSTHSTAAPPTGKNTLGDTRQHWPSESDMYAQRSSNPQTRHLSHDSLVASTTDGRSFPLSPRSHARYGLAVSYHSRAENGAIPTSSASSKDVPYLRPGDRNSVPDHRPMVNLVTERMKKFESADSVDSIGSSHGSTNTSANPAWRTARDSPHNNNRAVPRVGYDSVVSRAARYESLGQETSGGEDTPERRPGSKQSSYFSTPTGSCSSLSQAAPPGEMERGPLTPPGIIPYYFRKDSIETLHDTAHVESSPERTRQVGHLATPPRSGLKVTSAEDLSYVSSPGDRQHKAARRQPSYLAAIHSPKQKDHQQQVSEAADPTPPSSPSQAVAPTSHSMSPPSSPQPASHPSSPASHPSSPRAAPFRQRLNIKLKSRSSSARSGLAAALSTMVPLAVISGDRHSSPAAPDGSTVVLRESTLSAEEREARLRRRTSYLMATQQTAPPPGATLTQPALPQLHMRGSGSAPRLQLELPLPFPLEAGEGDSKRVTFSPQSKSAPPTPTSPPSPVSLKSADGATTPTKTSNIRKLKNLFGERTPRIMDAIQDRKCLFDMPSPAGDLILEGPLSCKIAVMDGKRASDRSWKPVFAQLRGHALYIFKDRSSVSPTTFEDQPISIKSAIVDIAYDYTKKKNVWRLTTYNGSEYLFQAEDHDSMLHWIRLVQANNNPDQDTDHIASSDLIVRKCVEYEASQSPSQVSSQKVKKPSSRSLRSKSPSSHSPGPKPRKQSTEHADSPKSKDSKTWRGRMVKKIKRYGSSSSSSADVPETSDAGEVTGTFYVPLDMCPPSKENEFVPMVVTVCCGIIETLGLENQGIYRVPGNTGSVNMLQEEFNRCAEQEDLDLQNERLNDVNVVGSLLKSFFRKLPDPLISDDRPNDELYDSVINANRLENPEKRMLKIKKLLHDLPDHNQETFHYLAQHLSRVAAKGDLNKMDARNLAIVFGPTLVRPREDSMVTMVRDMSDQCRIVENIILHVNWFFSSWDEDVNVPVDQQQHIPVPVSGMNRELLVKAEGLEERGRDISAKDLMSSLFQPAIRKMRRKDKKSGESVDADPDSEPSYNERNIDREIELRKLELSQTSLISQTTTLTSQTSQTSHSSLAKESSSSSLAAALAAQSMQSAQSVHSIQSAQSAQSLSGDHRSGGQNTAVSCRSVVPHESSKKPMDRKDSEGSMGGATPKDQAAARFQLMRYPAYPPPNLASQSVENSKPMLLKKFSDSPGEQRRTPPPSQQQPQQTQHVPEDQKYGLTYAARQHLRRLEQETAAMKEQHQRAQEQRAVEKQRVEDELQRSRRELQLDMEQDSNGDEILGRPADMAAKISDMTAKYADYINCIFEGQEGESGPSGHGGGQQTKGAASPPQVATVRHQGSANQSTPPPPPSRVTEGGPSPQGSQGGKYFFMTTVTPTQGRSPPGGPAHDDIDLYRKNSWRSSWFDTRKLVGPGRLAASNGTDLAESGRGDGRGSRGSSGSPGQHPDVVGKPRGAAEQLGVSCQRRGSLDSLLDHMGDSDSDKSESLLESLAAADQRFQSLLGSQATTAGGGVVRRTHSPNPSHIESSRRPVSGPPLPVHRSTSRPARPAPSDSALFDNQPFRDPSLHRAAHKETVVGIASRFERQDPVPQVDGSPLRQDKENIQPLNKITHDRKLTESSQQHTDKLFAGFPLTPPASSTSQSHAAPKGGASPAHGHHGNKRASWRRHTVGGTHDTHLRKALVQASPSKGGTAWSQLQPGVRCSGEPWDMHSWLARERLRHVGSSPALLTSPLSLQQSPESASPRQHTPKSGGSGSSSPASPALFPTTRGRSSKFTFESAI